MTKNGSNILVAAAAGSGKTAVLVERIIHKIIDEKMDIDKILVVTFTNAAASEMRERILDAIYKKLEEEPQNTHLQRQLTLLPKASICTIHSFCLDVIHNYFYEIDLASNFRIADTVEIDLLKQEVLDDLFEQKYLENNSDFIELLETYTNYRGDEALQALILTIYRFMQSNPFPEKWLQEKLNLLTKNEEIKDFAETIWGKIILEYIKEEIEEAYEKNTGLVIIETFKDKNPVYVPGVLCTNHGPFTWGADAAEALAIMVAGSNEEFAKLMNEKCKELGLKYTHFTNPTGLYDEEQYTTPSEMAMIMEYAMKDETRAKVLGTYQYKTKATEQHPEGIPLTSTMYSRIYGNEAPGVLVKGGKTGFTNEAGSCLVSYAVTNKGNAYVFCTGGATYRWAPVYDEIYVYKNIIPASAKDLETETTKMSPNN